MTDYGIKISRPGYDVKTATPPQLSFSSKYGTLKIQARGNGTVNSASGGGLATIAHGLEYVPAFLVHVDPGQTGSYCIAPYGVNSTPLIYAYADSTNLYIKAVANVVETTYYNASDTNMWRAYDGGFSGNGGFAIGKTDVKINGALRFENIAVAQGTTITDAVLGVYVGEKGAGTGDMTYFTFGIDEDNTANFSSDPLGRNKTTANHGGSAALTGAGGFQNFNVTNESNEIFARGSWSSGNAIGYIFNAGDDCPAQVYIYDDNTGTTTNSKLSITTTTATVANYKYTVFLNQIE